MLRGWIVGVLCAWGGTALADTFLVSNSLDSGPGSLREAIINANRTEGTHVIDFAPGLDPIGVGYHLPPVLRDVTFNGNGNTVSGGDQWRLFLVGDGGNAVNVGINDLTLADGRAQGGDGGPGGGGGAGLGGALFVNASASVSVSNVRFDGNEAHGGTGGTGSGGGGGGMGGDGGSSGGGGGGLGGNGGSNHGGGGGLGGNGANGGSASITYLSTTPNQAWTGGGGGGLNSLVGTGRNASPATAGSGAGQGGGTGGSIGGGGGGGSGSLLNSAGQNGFSGSGSGLGGQGATGSGTYSPSGGWISLWVGVGGGGGGGDGGGMGAADGWLVSGGAGGFGGGGGGEGTWVSASQFPSGGSGGWGGGGGSGGGTGGFGGGGGSQSGAGGFGGGGGSSQTVFIPSSPGVGGFGGGAGSGNPTLLIISFPWDPNPTPPRFAGYGGGEATNSSGGGGAGFGGAIFVREGGNLTIAGSVTAGGGVAPGLGGPGAGNGMAEGTDLFLMTNVAAVFDGFADNIFSGTIAGQPGDRGIVKNGVGTLQLMGSVTNSYKGGTTLNAGVLAVGKYGALGLGVLRVAGGVLRAEGAQRDIRVFGGYEQSGGSLALRLGGTGDGQFDRLVVDGCVSLGGDLTLVPEGAFIPLKQDQWLIIDNDASDPVAGEFATITDGFAALDFALDYAAGDGNDVLLMVAPVPFEEAIGSDFDGAPVTPNQRAVARMLDHTIGGVSGDFEEVLGELMTLSVGELRDAMDQIAPEELGAMSAMAFAHAQVQAGHMERRFRELREGITGFSGVMFSMDEAIERIDWERTTLVAGVGEAAKAVTPATDFMRSGADNRWGVFLSGSGTMADIESTAFEAGGEFYTAGMTLGVDYRPCEGFAFGAFGGYAGGEADIDRDGGTLGVDSTRLGVYATAWAGGFYANALAGGSWNDYDTRRRLVFGDIDRTARGNTESCEFNGLVGIGHDWLAGAWTFGPLASVQYNRLMVDGYIEDGADSLDLAIEDQDAESLQTQLGARIAHACQFPGWSLIPEARAQWEHEFEDDARPIEARLASAGKPFHVSTLGPDRDRAIVGVGLTALFGDHVSAYLDWTAELGDELSAHTLGAGLRLEW